MARKKAVSQKKVPMMTDTVNDLITSPSKKETMSLLQSSMWSRKYIIGGVILVLLVGLLVINKSLWLAAVVNGKPIFRWELNKILVQRFGQQTLEGMVTERLIADAAASSGVVITQADLDAKVKEVEASLGTNVNIDDLLKYQGMTRKDFESQVRLQLTVEKVLGRDITIAESDIDAFIATNAATLAATDEAALREEAKSAIFSQKIGERVQPWFGELKEKAKILRYL